MNISHYIIAVNLLEKTEIQKVALIAFYQIKTEKKATFYLSEVFETLKNLGHSISNISRMKSKITKSRDFKKVGSGDEYSLTPVSLKKLQTEYSQMFIHNEEIISTSEVLDESLFIGKRGYLDRLIKQINNCYFNNCYDACAVLMRRVFEISLILAYKHKSIEYQIKDNNGDYVLLEKIVANATQNKALNISRSRKEYDTIRKLGNFAAHRIHFNTRQSDIDDIKQIYRVCLEELFYISGLLK